MNARSMRMRGRWVIVGPRELMLPGARVEVEMRGGGTQTRFLDRIVVPLPGGEAWALPSKRDQPGAPWMSWSKAIDRDT